MARRLTKKLLRCEARQWTAAESSWLPLLLAVSRSRSRMVGLVRPLDWLVANVRRRDGRPVWWRSGAAHPTGYTDNGLLHSSPTILCPLEAGIVSLVARRPLDLRELHSTSLVPGTERKEGCCESLSNRTY